MMSGLGRVMAVGCNAAAGPYPVLCLHGEQGSAKSTAARVLRELVDPNTAPLRSSPREPRDLDDRGKQRVGRLRWTICPTYPWFSDALCRLINGRGISTRDCTPTMEEVIFDSQAASHRHGIEEVVTRGDLVDRSLLVSLPTIPDELGDSREQILEVFNKRKPGLFGSDADGCL